MNSWSHDDWIRSHSLVTPEKLHAIGFLTLAWNACEYWTTAIFSTVSGLSEKQARIVTHDLGDITIWNKIIEFSGIDELTGTHVKDELKHALKIYDRCRSNRNQFVHAALGGERGEDGSVFRLARNKGPKFEFDPIDDSLQEIRRVGDEIDRLRDYLARLCIHISSLKFETPSPLPERLPLPECVWKPPQTKRNKRKPQPQSSPA